MVPTILYEPFYNVRLFGVGKQLFHYHLGLSAELQCHNLSQNKSIFEWIIGIDPQFVATNNMRFTRDLRNDRWIWTESGLFDDFARELAADDTFDRNGFIFFDFTAPMMNCKSSADTSASGAAIHFTLGKDTHILTLRSCLRRRTDNDRAT